MSIIFIDKNKKLCKRVEEVFEKHEYSFQENFLEVRNEDTREIDRGVFVTASNPDFNPAGGLDAILYKKYPKEWKDLKEGVKTRHLFPVISVDRNGVASRERVKRALVLVFYREWVGNIYLTGIGTRIGGLSVEDFIEVLREVLSRDLKKIDLSRAYMEGINLSCADLEEADLSDANLRGADLQSANLESACLDDANLVRAHLPRSNFKYASLKGANMLSAVSHGCNFSYASLDATCLRDANLRWSIFCDASLMGTDLTYAKLDGCNLAGANLSTSNMSEACLEKAVLSQANLDGANLCGALLGGAVFGDSLMYGIRISEDTSLASTCFDALTIREFLRKYKIRRNKDKIKLYRGVHEDYTSPCVTGSSIIRYKIGKTYEVELCNFNAGDECGHGLNVCPTKELARNYGKKVLQVGIDIRDIVAIPRDGSKVRVKKFKILKEVK